MYSNARSSLLAVVHTLVQMLNILGNFPVSRGEPTAEEVELVARVIGQAMEDRPQMLGTLAPKPGGLPLDVISSQEFARERADRIRQQMRQLKPAQEKQDDSAVPTGLAEDSGAVPSDESLGYLQVSLRDTMLPRSGPGGAQENSPGLQP